jgi:hypothetical protein
MDSRNGGTGQRYAHGLNLTYRECPLADRHPTWAFVVERVTSIELALSAWEVSSPIRGLPAETLTCDILACLATSDRESPSGLTRSGT